MIKINHIGHVLTGVTYIDTYEVTYSVATLIYDNYYILIYEIILTPY